MPRYVPPAKKTVKRAASKPITLRKEPYTRSEIIQMDMYVNDRTGENTQKNETLLRMIHAKYLNEHHPRDQDEDNQDDDINIDHDDLQLAYHICDSYENRGLYCVYDDRVDPANDHCCYCGMPDERK